MNSVTKVEGCPRLDAEALYRLVTTKGQGCLCGGMSNLFCRVLILQDIPARVVFFTPGSD